MSSELDVQFIIAMEYLIHQQLSSTPLLPEKRVVLRAVQADAARRVLGDRDYLKCLLDSNAPGYQLVMARVNLTDADYALAQDPEILKKISAGETPHINECVRVARNFHPV